MHERYIGSHRLDLGDQLAHLWDKQHIYKCKLSLSLLMS